jgi:hypothetical protein
MADGTGGGLVVLRYVPQVRRGLRGKGVGQQYNYI